MRKHRSGRAHSTNTHVFVFKIEHIYIIRRQCQTVRLRTVMKMETYYTVKTTYSQSSNTATIEYLEPQTAETAPPNGLVTLRESDGPDGTIIEETVCFKDQQDAYDYVGLPVHWNWDDLKTECDAANKPDAKPIIRDPHYYRVTSIYINDGSGRRMFEIDEVRRGFSRYHHTTDDGMITVVENMFKSLHEAQVHVEYYGGVRCISAKIQGVQSKSG